MTTLLIDGDVLVYEAAKANEYETQWDEDLWTLHANLDPAIAHLDNAVEVLKEKLNAGDVVMALSDYEDPWRKRVMPTYKANRKAARKPVIYRPLREYVHAAYTTYQRQGLEGDDILGILLTHPSIVEGDKILVSIDKDMQTLPGEHYKMRHDERFTVRTAFADRMHLFQTLMGDATDGYPGCPGVGPKGAAKILGPFYRSDTIDPDEDTFDNAGAWAAVVLAYQKAGLSEDVALQNARVARILRHNEYNFKEHQVRLWNPL